MSMELLLSLSFPAAMVVAAGTDVWRMEIPNALVLVLAIMFVPMVASSGLGFIDLALHVVVGLAALVVGIGFFSIGWMGGGDAKLIAAGALWLGPGPALAEFVLLFSLLGGVLTVAIVVARRVIAPTTGVRSVDRILHAGNGIPYGVALCAAGLSVYSSPNFPF